MRAWGRSVAAVAAVALLAVACGGGDGTEPGGNDEPGQESPPADGDDAALAALGIIEPGVDVADEPGGLEGAPFRPGEDGESLVVRDFVRTDADGYAEVRWTEGALARIDVDTVFEVTELDLATGQPVISTRLEVGRVWSRLDSGAADYEIATDVGTAAVRGTGFLVSCIQACVFGLAEGVLEVVTSLGIELELRPGEQVEVNQDGQPGEIEPFDSDDPWVQDNLGRDEDVGFAPVTAPEDDPDDDRDDTARGRMDGPYDFTFTVQESTAEQTVGQEVPRRWVWFPECDSGPCGGEWDPGDGNREPFRWTGQGYTASWVDRPAGQCPDGTNRWLEDFVLVITPTAVDDTGLVSALDATWTSTLTPTAEAVASGCDGGDEVDQVLTGSATPAA